MNNIPTVKVHHPTIEGEWMLINESDFDPAVHTLYVDAALVQSPAPPPAQPDISPALLRTQELQLLHQAEGWAAIKAIAEPLGITKPSGGWDDAISRIVAVEFGGEGE